MRELPRRVRRQVARGALRAWTAHTVRWVRSQLPRRSGRLRASIAGKVRSNRRGVWAVVGGKTTTKERQGIHRSAKLRQSIGNDYLGAGWRLHFADRGFRPGGGSTVVQGSHVMRRAAVVTRFWLAERLQRDMAAALREARL